MRRSLSTTARVRVFEAAGGICHLCNGKITVGERWEVSHDRPLALGGSDTPDNMKPAHYSCHRAQTSETDIPAIAKAKRRYAKFIGATAPKARPLAGSRASGLRKRMNGTVERWPR